MFVGLDSCTQAFIRGRDKLCWHFGDEAVKKTQSPRGQTNTELNWIKNLLGLFWVLVLAIA